MATHTVARSKHFTLTGSSTIDEVVLEDEPTKVEVLNRGDTDPVWFTIAAGEEPANPAVLGDDTYVVAAGQWLVVPLPTAQGPTQVKLTASTAVDVSVTGMD